MYKYNHYVTNPKYTRLGWALLLVGTVISLFYFFLFREPPERTKIELTVHWDTEDVVNFDADTGLPDQFLWKWKRNPPLLENTSEIDDYFGPILTPSERETLLETLEFCVRLLNVLKHRPVLFGGSLLGWYRHNKTMIPWDDDVDLMVISVGRPDEFASFLARQLTLLAEQLAPPGVTYGVWVHTEYHLIKIFRADDNTRPIYGATNGLVFRWPFVDILIFDTVTFQGSGTPSLLYNWRGESYLYPHELLFPVKGITFESVHLDAPRNIPAMLQITYDSIDTCTSRLNNHRSTESEHPRRMNCSELFQINRKYFQYPKS